MGGPTSLPPALGVALLLADGRTPTGGHAHSCGVEQAAADGMLGDIEDLAAFLAGRLWTAGLTAAGLAAAACRLAVDAATSDPGRWWALDAEADARIPSAAQRTTSRQLGRHLLRTALAACPEPLLSMLQTDATPGPHHPVALGAVAGRAGAGPQAAAAVVAHESITGPAGAAVRLLGLDPGCATRVLAGLAPAVDAVAYRAAAAAEGSWAELPAAAAPLADVLAERHATRNGALFAS